MSDKCDQRHGYTNDSPSSAPPSFTSEQNHSSSIPSLQSLCIVFIYENCQNTIEQTVFLYQRFAALGLINSLTQEAFDTNTRTILRKLQDNLCSRFDVLIKKYGEESVRNDILGDELFGICYKQQQERLNAERKLAGYRLGNPLEPPKVDFEDCGNGIYPYKTLISGVQWPVGIAPDKREQYLSEEEFLQVFGMNKDSFNELDKFMRQRLKKEKNLF